eukprot:806592_1
MSVYRIGKDVVGEEDDDFEVTAISISPDESQLLISYHPPAILSYNLTLQSVEHRFRCVGVDDITCLAWHRSGDFFATGHDDGEIQIWKRKESNSPVQKIRIASDHEGERESVTSLRFIPRFKSEPRYYTVLYVSGGHPSDWPSDLCSSGSVFVGKDCSSLVPAENSIFPPLYHDGESEYVKSKRKLVDFRMFSIPHRPMSLDSDSDVGVRDGDRWGMIAAFNDHLVVSDGGESSRTSVDIRPDFTDVLHIQYISLSSCDDDLGIFDCIDRLKSSPTEENLNFFEFLDRSRSVASPSQRLRKWGWPLSCGHDENSCIEADGVLVTSHSSMRINFWSCSADQRIIEPILSIDLKKFLGEAIKSKKPLSAMKVCDKSRRIFLGFEDGEVVGFEIQTSSESGVLLKPLWRVSIHLGAITCFEVSSVHDRLAMFDATGTYSMVRASTG